MEDMLQLLKAQQGIFTPKQSSVNRMFVVTKLLHFSKSLSKFIEAVILCSLTWEYIQLMSVGLSSWAVASVCSQQSQNTVALGTYLVPCC